MRDLVRRLRKDGFPMNWAWSVEENPEKTGFHVHCIEHGSFLPQDHLQDRWGAIVYIDEIKRDANSYLAKCYRVAGYQAKVAEQHLALNGHRAIHHTRGYLHGFNARQVCRMMGQGKEWNVRLATEVEMSEVEHDHVEGDKQSDTSTIDIPWKVGRVIDDPHGLPTITLTDGF